MTRNEECKRKMKSNDCSQQYLQTPFFWPHYLYVGTALEQDAKVSRVKVTQLDDE